MYQTILQNVSLYSFIQLCFCTITIFAFKPFPCFWLGVFDKANQGIKVYCFFLVVCSLTSFGIATFSE